SSHVLVAQVVELLPKRHGIQLGPDQTARRARGCGGRERRLGELEAQGEEPQLLRPKPEPGPVGVERPVHNQRLATPRAMFAVRHGSDPPSDRQPRLKPPRLAVRPPYPTRPTRPGGWAPEGLLPEATPVGVCPI